MERQWNWCHIVNWDDSNLLLFVYQVSHFGTDRRMGDNDQWYSFQREKKCFIRDEILPTSVPSGESYCRSQLVLTLSTSLIIRYHSQTVSFPNHMLLQFWFNIFPLLLFCQNECAHGDPMTLIWMRSLRWGTEPSNSIWVGTQCSFLTKERKVIHTSQKATVRPYRRHQVIIYRVCKLQPQTLSDRILYISGFDFMITWDWLSHNSCIYEQWYSSESFGVTSRNLKWWTTTSLLLPEWNNSKYLISDCGRCLVLSLFSSSPI